jgi:hypothetical protein
MSKIYKAFAFLFLVLFVLSIATPANFSANTISKTHRNTSFEPAATDYVVSITVFNYQLAFNDDDFRFLVKNGTTPLSLAWVRLYNITTGFLEDEHQTDGIGIADFINLPQGTYQWNVSDPSDPITPQKTGQIVSNGPEANVDIEFGNLDWQNNNDDLNATITDIEGNPAENLNFSVLWTSNNSIYAQDVVTNGNAYFENLPEGNYTWRLTVLYDPKYAGYLLASGQVESNGTQILVHQSIGQLAGSPDYLDMEIFTYYETSLYPIVGANVTVTYKNGTLIGSKITPANGTLMFVDLPVAFINWTVIYLGLPVGLGAYSYNLTDVASDVRDPIITGPGDKDVLIGAENVTLTWTLHDEYPYSIQVWIDGALNDTSSWENTTYNYVFNVTAAFPKFVIGYYKIKLVAMDQNSNSAENTLTLRFYENVTPVIEGPGPVEIFFSETGHTLSWNVTDDYVNMYRVLDNQTNVQNGTIDPDEPVIQISLDGLSIGIHNFTLYANDTSGNTAANSVLVTVLGDTIPPVITYSPSAIHYAQGAENKIYNWTATDDFKESYEILVDGAVVVTGSWTTENIEFDFGGLAQGEHNVTLRVYDIGGNMAESVVLVTVTASTASEYLFYTAVIALGLIAVIAVIWFVRYR